MVIDDDCVMWTARVGQSLVIVTAWLLTITCGNGVIKRVYVTAHVL